MEASARHVAVQQYLYAVQHERSQGLIVQRTKIATDCPKMELLAA
jgi:hypothetical protein